MQRIKTWLTHKINIANIIARKKRETTHGLIKIINNCDDYKWQQKQHNLTHEQ